jgi:inhibitor of cysteine peptidase
MKSKALVALMLAGLLLGAVACSTAQGATDTDQPNTGGPPAPDKYLVNITGEDFSGEANIERQVEVKTGDIFNIALDSNGTTGFQWTADANIADTAVLEQTAHDYIAPNNGGIIGAPGTEEWTFKALKAGTTAVKMSYDRPWEGGEKGVRTFELTVVVK